MKSPALLLLLALLLTLPAQAQDRSGRRGGGQSAPRGTVSGTVVDAETGEGIPSATVALRSAQDSSLVTGAITQGDGSFAIENIRPGRYYARLSYVGYAPETVSDMEIRRGQLTADLGEIALAADASELDEVEVEAERDFVEVGLDKNTYNVRDQPTTAGGSALSVLETIPSVAVDIDDNISLRGNENVAIYLNGKPAPMTGEALSGFLAGLPADAIARVEVIPNPSARYEPEGLSGIINIVLAQDQGRGFGGNVSLSAGTRGRYNASASTHYGEGPWSFFGSYGLRYGERERDGTRFRENRFRDPLTYLDEDLDGASGRLSHTLNTSLDYRLSEKNTLSLSAILSRRAGDEDASTTYAELDADRDPTLRYLRSTDGDGTDTGMDYRLSFKRVTKPSENELSIEARYEQEWESETERFAEELLDGIGGAALDEEQITEEDETSQEASLQADYVRPLGGALRMETGYKGEWERLESRFFSETFNPGAGVFLPDVNLNNRFNYDEQIHAAYGILSGERGLFGAQVGLRAERALTTFDLETTGEDFGNDYFSFYPSAFFTFKPTERHTVKLSYSKRVDRPSTWQLNPFGDLTDPTSRRVGNPALDPEYTHAFEAGYTHLGDAFTISATPYYRHTVDAISWSERLTDEGITVVTFENFATRDSYGLELIGSATLFSKRLRANGSFNAFRSVTDGSNVDTDFTSDALSFMTRLSATWQVRPGLGLQLSQFYRAPHDIPGGRIEAFTRTDLALKQDLFGGRGSLSLSASDVFDQMGFSLERESDQYYQTFSRDFDAQGLQLSFQYNFGQEDKGRRDRRRGERGGEEMDEDVQMQ